jgi:hypothetical protein
MTTLNKLTEQVMRIFSRGTGSPENVNPLVDRREVKLLVVQATHEILAMETKDAIRLGDVNIPTCMIATYENIDVVGDTGAKYTDLPAFPIKLPQDMGVWSVVSSDRIPYIPITTAAWDLLGAMDEGLIEDQIGFYVEGRKIKFTQDPTETVTIKLLVIDPAEIGENDPYPVPPEIEGQVIQRVLQLLAPMGVQPEKPKG